MNKMEKVTTFRKLIFESTKYFLKSLNRKAKNIKKANKSISDKEINVMK